MTILLCLFVCQLLCLGNAAFGTVGTKPIGAGISKASVDRRAEAPIGTADAEGDSAELKWLIDEADRLEELKGSVRGFLVSRGIPIPGRCTAPQMSTDAISAPILRIIESNIANNVNCRISLDRVPEGEIAVSPCRCTGTNEWVRFAVYNRMRRQDPGQWASCRTCGSPFASAAPLYANAALTPRLLSVVLDHPASIRAIAAVVAINMLRRLSAGAAARRVLVSKSLWLQYPHWSRVTHLPLPMKLYILKIVGQQGMNLWELFEKYLISKLADVETDLIASDQHSVSWNKEVAKNILEI